MAMGRRKRGAKQRPLFVATEEIARPAAANQFYEALNRILTRHRFDERVEYLCKRYYRPTIGRPSLSPGVYFRCLFIGFFEGLDSERGIAWRAADSLSLRQFLGYEVNELPPDHSTLSRTRRLLSVETHKAVFRWVNQILIQSGLIKGQTISIDSTTLEANAAMRSIVRRDTGIGYEGWLSEVARAEGHRGRSRLRDTGESAMDWKLGGLSLIALLLAASASEPCVAQVTTGATLVEWEDEDNPMLLGWIKGSAETWQGAYYASGEQLQRWCIPDNSVSVGQVQAIVMKHTRAAPEKWHFPASLLVAQALIEAFPCPKPAE